MSTRVLVNFEDFTKLTAVLRPIVFNLLRHRTEAAGHPTKTIIAYDHHPDPPRLVDRRNRLAPRSALQRSVVSCPVRAPRPLRSQPGAGEHPAQHQDRGLPGGLRLLLPEREARHGAGARASAPRRRGADGRPAAKDKGATRFCMGAAWRNPTDKNLEQVAR